LRLCLALVALTVLLWGMSEQALLSDTEIRFPEPTAWDQFGSLIITALALIVAQSVLLAALLIHWVRRRRAEAALRKSEERYRALVTVSDQVVWCISPAEEPIRGASAWQELTGQTREEMQGAGWLDAVHPDDRAKAASDWERAVQTRAIYESEMRVRACDGSYRDIQTQGVPVMGADGRVREWVGTNRDVTEQKAAAEALRQARTELRLAGRVMMAGELTSTIAHEVNQPLGAVLLNADACLRMLAQPSPDLAEVKRAVEDIADDGKRARQVIERIRALVTRSPAQREPLEVNALVQEVTGLLQGELRARRVSLHLDLAEALPRVLGDRVQLQQAILNLVLNGLDAMGSVTDRPRELRVASRRMGPDWLELEIRDTGIGFDPEDQEQLFDPLYTTKPGGMGMGLSITQAIIDEHGGQLWAMPSADHGATFHFTLPALEEAATRRVDLGSTAPRAGVSSDHESRATVPARAESTPRLPV
jgi:PAS domain S-box-containing protein